MRHQVEGACLVCVDTTRPYSNGATYRIDGGAKAVVLVGGVHHEIKNSAQSARCFKVSHRVSIDTHNDPLVTVTVTDVL